MRTISVETEITGKGDVLGGAARREKVKRLTTDIFRALLILIGLCLLASCNSQSNFPEVRNDKLLISLQRTACYGSCPDYKVTIDGQGNVVFASRPPVQDEAASVHREFSTSTGVRVSGMYRTVVSKADIAELLDKFRSADFFSLRDEYTAEVTDNPTYILSIDTGNGSKTVVDYVGDKAGMPPVVTALQDAVDKTAGTDRWIKGLPSVIPVLEALKAEFGGAIGLELMDAAAERGDLATLQRLKAKGAPVYGQQGPTPLISAIHEKQNMAADWLIANGALKQETAYESALAASVSTGSHRMFEAVLQAGQKGITKNLATELLLSAAGNADLRIVNLMLANGANPNGPKDAPGLPDPPLFNAANGIEADEQRHPMSERRKVVRTLLDAGANITHCLNDYCSSVLWQVDDRQIAKMLIDAGADPNFLDSDGEHILFNISNEQVALLLIERGADLKTVRPADGMTLRGWAKYEKWPRVIKILNSRGL